MTDREFSITATEVLFLLQYFRIQDVEKIPNEFINYLENASDKDYVVTFDRTKLLTELDLNKNTKALLGLIYKNYWCNDTEREEYNKLLLENENKKQKKSLEKYNPNKIFDNNTKVSTAGNQQENSSELSLIDNKDLKWFYKLKNKIINIFKNLRRKKL